MIAALANSYVGKANPSLAISDIAITSQFNIRFGAHKLVQIPLGDELFHHLEQSMWTTSVRSSSADLNKITTTLTDDRNDVEQLLTNIRDFQRVLFEIKNLLSGPSSRFAAETLFDKWEPLDGFIWSAIDGQLRRGTFASPKFTGDSTSRNEMLRYETQRTDDGHTVFLISRPGDKHRIVIAPSGDEDKDDAKQLAKALEYFDQPMLQRFVEAVEAEVATYELHLQMKKELRRYLKAYSRWVVAVFISNSGSDPISFSPNSTLYCNTKGTSVGDTYAFFDLQNRQPNGELEPITVAGGDSKAVSFASVNLIISNPNWGQLLDLYASSSRNCFIALHAASGRWLVRSDLFSPLATFGPSSRGQQLTEKEIARRFGE